MGARRTGRVLTALLAALLLLPMLASPVGAAGPGSGGGGGGGGGSQPPADDPGSLYADLTIVLRAANGTPILKRYDVPADADSEATTEYCVQPISYEEVPGLTSTTNQVDGRTVWVLPLQGEWIGSTDPLPVEEIEPCDPKPQYAMFVSEVEMERLNLTRTSDTVIAEKLADVQEKLFLGTAITLDATGRIRIDDKVIDASPENAAIYKSLMESGTIPGLPLTATSDPVPPATIGPESTTGNSQFDAWELAAMAIGAAASKGTPLTIDAVEYYSRIVGFPPVVEPPLKEYASPWGVKFVQSEDPSNLGSPLAGAELLVDYSDFSYNRSETFKGSVTWLDVSTLTWKVSKITDVVPFTNLTGLPQIGTETLTGVTAFVQLADDVRSLANYVPDNTFIPGFYMDVPGADTTVAQGWAITHPAVDLGTLPRDVFQTYPFWVTMSLLNPWGGSVIDEAQLRILIDAETDFVLGDVTATAADGQSVPFEVVNGDLVGRWGPASGFPVQPGYNMSTTFDVMIADSAPLGDYAITLVVVDIDDLGTALASESGSIMVNDNVPTVLWGVPLPRLVTQGSAMRLPLQVYSPTAGPGTLMLRITGPDDDPTTPETETLTPGSLRVYGSDGTDMVRMSLSIDADGLVGTWPVALAAGYTPVTWYVTVLEGSPVGPYLFGVTLNGANTLDPIEVFVVAPETHGEQPPDSGEDTTPPIVTITPEISGSTATFVLTADDVGVIFDCQLTMNGIVLEAWAPCTSPKTYTNLMPGDYLLEVVGTRGELDSEIVTYGWTVPITPGDTTPPTVLDLAPVGTPGATATFTFTADETPVLFECRLTKNGRAGAWEVCTSPVTYENLKPATYVVSVRATDEAGNESVVVIYEWTVARNTRNAK